MYVSLIYDGGHRVKNIQVTHIRKPINLYSDYTKT